MVPSLGLLKNPDLISAQVLVHDVPLSSISDTMSQSFHQEVIGDVSISTLDPAMDHYPNHSTESIHGFQLEDAFFADFEVFDPVLSDQYFSQAEPTIDSSDQLTTISKSQSPEYDSSDTPSKHCADVSALPWVAARCKHPPCQLSTACTAESSLTPETVDSLLKDYFQFVNPTWPIVSEWDVYRLVHPQENDAGERLPPMSLAFFYAIMFAACAVLYP